MRQFERVSGVRVADLDCSPPMYNELQRRKRKQCDDLLGCKSTRADSDVANLCREISVREARIRLCISARMRRDLCWAVVEGDGKIDDGHRDIVDSLNTALSRCARKALDLRCR